MPRAHDNGPFKEFDFADWFCENLRDFEEDIKHSRQSMRGQSFRKHVRNAVKEQLLAVRDVVDAAIEQIDKKETKTRRA